MDRILTFIAFVLFSSTISFASNQLPLDYFTKHGDYLDMSLSPDGKHISARVRSEGRIYLLVLNTETMKSVTGIEPPEGDEVHSAQWVSNNRLVYQLRELKRWVDRPVSTGELFSIDIETNKDNILFGYRAGEFGSVSRLKRQEATFASADILSTLPDDDNYILIAEYPWTEGGGYWRYDDTRLPKVSRLNVRSGKKTNSETIPFPGARLLATDTGIVKYARYSGEDGVERAVYRTNADSEWQDVDASYTPIQLSTDGTTAYLSGKVGEKEIYTIFELDTASGKITQLFSDMNADIAYYNWDRKLQKPVVAFSYPDKHVYHYASGASRIGAIHKSLAEAFKGQHVSIASQNNDASLLIVRVTSDVNPGEYYLFNAKSNGATFLWANRSWLDPRTMANKTPIKFKSEDGLEINGYITLPNKTDESKKVPMVVVIHGGPYYVRDDWGFDGEVQLLANRGYAVLQVNFRGSDGYGQAFENAGYLEWGGKMIQDIIQGTHHAIDKFAIDADKVCVYGASYGGYAAMMSAVRAPDLYKCAVGYVGVYDLNYVYSESDIVDILGGRAYLEKVIGTDKEVLDEFSPINHVDKIKANVMLIHGDKDSRVPVINADEMHKKLTAAGKDVPYLNFSKGAHGIYDEQGRKELYQALVDFIDNNIGE